MEKQFGSFTKKQLALKRCIFFWKTNWQWRAKTISSQENKGLLMQKKESGKPFFWSIYFSSVFQSSPKTDALWRRGRILCWGLIDELLSVDLAKTLKLLARLKLQRGLLLLWEPISQKWSFQKPHMWWGAQAWHLNSQLGQFQGFFTATLFQNLKEENY